MAQTPVTLNDLEGQFSYLMLLTHFLGNMTGIKFFYENRRAYVACDPECHSSVLGLFKCKSSTFCAAIYKISTGKPASHDPSATAGLLVF